MLFEHWQFLMVFILLQVAHATRIRMVSALWSNVCQPGSALCNACGVTATPNGLSPTLSMRESTPPPSLWWLLPHSTKPTKVRMKCSLKIQASVLMRTDLILKHLIILVYDRSNDQQNLFSANVTQFTSKWERNLNFLYWMDDVQRSGSF